MTRRSSFSSDAGLDVWNTSNAASGNDASTWVPRSALCDGFACEIRECTPRVRILRHERTEVQRHIFLRILRRQFRCRGLELFRVGLGGVVLADQSVLMRDAEEVEKRPHHRALMLEVIVDECAC